MTPAKLIKQCVENLLRDNIEQDFSEHSLTIMMMSLWEDLPPRLFHKALAEYLPRVHQALPDSRHSQVGNILIRQISNKDWHREKLVSLGRLGLCLGMIEKTLRHNEKLLWEEEDFTEIGRFQKRKTRRTDIRALGQIKKDAPELFRGVIDMKGNSETVSLNMLSFTMVQLKHHDDRKNILGNAEIKDCAWTVVGLIEELGEEKMAVGGRWAAFCAHYLNDAGVDELPDLDADMQKLEAGAPEYRPDPPENGWSMLRRASLSYISKKNSISEPAKKPRM